MGKGVHGIVLAGGRGLRMGGCDKAMLRLGGRPLLAHVLDRLRRQCSALVLSANGDPARFAAFGLTTVADDLDAAAGPLSGIVACLDEIAAQDGTARWAVSVPADTPFLPLDLVSRLSAARAASGLAAAQAASQGRLHPVAALWPVACRHELRRCIAIEGERRVGAVLARLGCVAVEWAAVPVDPFFNLNRPEELAAAEASIRSGGSGWPSG